MPEARPLLQLVDITVERKGTPLLASVALTVSPGLSENT